MIKKIIYTSHLEFRLKARNFPMSMPREIFEGAEEYFYDVKTKYYVAVAKYERREMIVIFDVKQEIELITIHPLKKLQKLNRIKSGRWIPASKESWL